MIVDLKAFQSSLSNPTCPKEFNICLQSLWFDGREDWEKAHDLVNDLTSQEAARVHAYLHRKEGDLGNADYWYRRAGATRPAITLNEEWQMLVKNFLEQ